MGVYTNEFTVPGDDNIRELLPYSYRLIYEIKGESVFVLAVIHKRRDLRPEMVERSGR